MSVERDWMPNGNGDFEKLFLPAARASYDGLEPSDRAELDDCIAYAATHRTVDGDRIFEIRVGAQEARLFICTESEWAIVFSAGMGGVLYWDFQRTIAV